MKRGTSPTPLPSTEAETNAGSGHEWPKQPRAGDLCAGYHERARFVRMGTSVDRSSTQSISEALSLHYASHGGVLWSALVALGGRSAVESISVVADRDRGTTIRDAWIVRVVFADAATAAATHRSVHIDLDGATSQMISTPYRPESHDAMFPTPVKSQPAPSPSPALVADPADRLAGGLKRDWQAVRGRDWRAVLPSHRLTEQPQTRPPQGHQAGAQGTTDSHGH